MATVDMFSLGWVSPALSFGLSFVGALLGLIAVAHCRTGLGFGARLRWLAIAALAIGGSTIWTSHYVAMTGFRENGAAVRYEMAQTALSWLTGVLLVGIGLLVAALGKPTVVRVLLGGVFCGMGESGMHIFSNSSMQLSGVQVFDGRLIGVSVVVAVVVATVVLWLTLTIRRPGAVAGCAALLTTGIVGMHYVVMQGMSIDIDEHRDHVGAGATTTAVSMVPLIILLLVLEAMMLFYALMRRSADDDEISTELFSWYTSVGVPSQRLSPSAPGARHRAAMHAGHRAGYRPR